MWVAPVAFADVQVVDGVTYECRDGLCWIVDDKPLAGVTNTTTEATAPRVTQGVQSADEFVRWLKGKDPPKNDLLVSSKGAASFCLGLLAILLGGLAMNLTPCVLPMIPVTLLIIGKSVSRGTWYGLGLALTYGALGLAASVGGVAFGTIQGNPWFNLVVAVIFFVLALALSGVFAIDFSRLRPSQSPRSSGNHSRLFPFALGSLSALLAGACVAPMLISVLLLTSKLSAAGTKVALALPFVFGLGMALPWPFLGAGMKVLPKPGKWMVWVNRAFALIVFGFGLWYGRLAWKGFGQEEVATSDGERSLAAATPSTFDERFAALKAKGTKPILVDCWASWCKNCAAMERTLSKPEVREALTDYEVIRLQAEDMRELRKLKGFEAIRGLPAFVVFE